MADQPAPRKLPQGAALLPAEVAEYLRRNPEFFAEHAELLAILTAPEQNRGAGIADMQRYMVQRLQTELRRRRAAEDDLVQTARANLAVQSRIHATTLALLGATTLDHLIELVTTDVALHLELDVVTLAFEALERTPPGGNRTGLRLLPTGAIETWLPRGREIVLIADQPGDPALFEGAAALVRSAALIRLDIRREAPLGLLAFGSRDPGHFHPGQATELLTYLGRVVALSIRSWLDRV